MAAKSAKELKRGSRALRAIAHPLRNAIQCILYNRMASSKEMADELEEDVSIVSYHVRDLKRRGNIKPMREAKRRGAVEHFYRAVVAPFHDDEEWAKLPRSTREGISAMTLQGLVAEATCALDEKTFDARTDRHLSRMCMDVDERGRREALECQAVLLARFERIKKESAERLQKKGTRGTRFLVGMIGVDLPQGRGLADRAD
jgi:DNA-binding transcriptional ArsR family regulator